MTVLNIPGKCVVGQKHVFGKPDTNQPNWYHKKRFIVPSKCSTCPEKSYIYTDTAQHDKQLSGRFMGQAFFWTAD